ncbi:unnamed protein product [Brassicogethes aeneus]|uniref:Uncharacterized protein n=1 Tax=Brassicogethes aeneus TaxID=1431903 RepID=A0A9P0BCB9_BRAAE|nr:unnamed protein product [Brassicogethes aeneus]
MEDIAFSDWPGQPADLNTGSNPWLPAYGFQTPSALLEKEDFIGNPEEPDGDLGELACPAKRRKQDTITLLSVVSFDGEESLSRSSSLLQFETLEQQCLEPATSTPSIFSFDPFESRKSNVSPDSLDTDWEKENDYYKSLNIDVPRRKDKNSSRDSLLYNNSEGSDTSEGTLEPSRSFDNLKTWKSFDSLPIGNTNKALIKEKLSTENLSEDSGYSDHLINNKSSSGGNLAKQLESAMKPIDSSVNSHFRKKRSCDGFGAYDGEVFHHISAAKRRLEETGPSTSSTVPRKKGNDVFDFKILCLFCGEVADEATKAKKSANYQDLSAFEKYEPCDEYRSPLITRFIKNKMHRRQTVLATPKTLNIDQDRAKFRPASASEPNLNQAVSENLVDCASVPRDLNLVGESSGGSVAAKNWDLTDLSVGDETVLVKCDDDMAKVKREGSYDMAMTNRVDLTDDEDSFCYTRKLPKTAIVEFDKKVLKAISEQSIQSIMASSGNLTETYLNEIYDVAKSTPNLVMNENELIDRYLEEERRKSTLDVRRKNSIIKSSTSTSGMSDLEDKTLTSCGSVASRGVHFSPVVSEVNWRDDDSVSTATPERESSVYSFESTPERDLVQRKKKLSTLAQRLSVSQPELSDTENCKRDFVDSLKSLRQDLSKSSQLIKKDEHGALVQAYVDRDGIQYKHTHLDLGVFQNSSAPTVAAPHHRNSEGGPQTAASRTTLSHANDMEAQHAQPSKEKNVSSRAKLGGFFSRLASFRFSNRKGQQEKSKLKKKQDAPKPQDDYIYIPLKGAAPENNNGPLLKQQQQQHAGGGGVSFAGKPPLPKQPPPTRQAPPRVVHASVKRDVATPPDVSAEKPRRRRRTTIDCVPPPPPRMEEQPMGLIETDLDTEVTVITSGCGNAKTRSLLDLGLGASKGAAAEGKRGLRAPEEAARPHKSMEYSSKNHLTVKCIDQKYMKLGEGRVMSEHQLRFQRSLQKLTVPEWCKQSQLPREGFLLNKHARHRESRWTGTGSHTNSLTNLGHQHQPNPAAPQSPASHFVRWSTSRLNSTASSPCASTRSSFNSRQPNGSISPSSVRSSFSYRQPYMGWRSQERIAHPKTPHERLANSFIVQTSQQESPELQNSIKEVTSAIVHYMSHLEGQEFHSQRSSSVSPRGSQKMCWLESSFVGVKPVDSPQTPLTLSESQSTTPVPQSNLQLDLQSQNDLTRNSGRLSPSSTTLEDVLDSLLGLPSAGGSGRAPSPSLQGRRHVGYKAVRT